MGYDPGGVEQVRCHVLFDPFGVGISISPFAPWVTPTATHIQAPLGLGFPNAHTLIQQQSGWGEGEPNSYCKLTLR